MPNIITIQHEVTDKFIWDVMTNTVETGACGYWAAIRHVMRATESTPDIYEFQVADAEDVSEAYQDLVDDGWSAESAANKVNNDPDFWNVIDKEAVIRGITLIMQGVDVDHPFPIDPDIRDMINRAVCEGDADIDAVGCDCIVQAAVFGELVYG